MTRPAYWLYRVMYALVWLALRFCHPVLRVSGKENIPNDPYVMVANHSAATDPLYVILAQNPKPLYAIMAKRQVLELPILGRLLKKVGVFAVDRDGTDSAAVMLSMRTLKSGRSLLLFPEGTRLRDGQRAPAKGGAVMLASRCKVPVVPVYISTEKRMFRSVRVIFGQPYHPQTSGRHISPEEQERLAGEMMDRCYALGEINEH